MKKRYAILLLVLFLASCSPAGTPLPTMVYDPTYTPLEGLPEYDACAFRVSVPLELSLEGSGWFVFLEAEEEEGVQVSIQARRREDDEQGATLEELAYALSESLAGESVDLTLTPTRVQDFLGDSLPAVRGEFVVDGQKYMILVVVRPETLLGDMLAEDVIYELAAQAPEAKWPDWSPIFEILFQSFQPVDCGGV